MNPQGRQLKETRVVKMHTLAKSLPREGEGTCLKERAKEFIQNLPVRDEDYWWNSSSDSIGAMAKSRYLMPTDCSVLFLCHILVRAILHYF